MIGTRIGTSSNDAGVELRQSEEGLPQHEEQLIFKPGGR
jgi:hypothetical protein